MCVTVQATRVSVGLIYIGLLLSLHDTNIGVRVFGPIVLLFCVFVCPL